MEKEKTKAVCLNQRYTSQRHVTLPSERRPTATGTASTNVRICHSGKNEVQRRRGVVNYLLRDKRVAASTRTQP
jgi:hypothetical protein